MILTIGRSSHNVCIKSVESKFLKKTLRGHIKIYSINTTLKSPPKISKNSSTETMPEQQNDATEAYDDFIQKIMVAIDSCDL